MPNNIKVYQRKVVKKTGIGKACCGAWILDARAHSGTNRVTGKTVSANSTPNSPFQSSYGMSHNFASSRFMDHGTPPIVKTSDGSGGGDFSVYIYANPQSIATFETMIGQRYGVGNSNQWRFAANSDASAGVSAGSVAFLTYNTAWSGVAAASMADSSFHSFVGVRRGSDLYLWRDGLKQATASPTLRNVYNSAGSFCIGATGANNADSYSKGIFVAYVWDRAIHDSEILQLEVDPFSVFMIPEKRPIVKLSAATGGFFSRYYYDMISTAGGRNV